MKASPAEQKELLRLQAIDTRMQQLDHQMKNLPQEATIAALTSQLDGVRRRHTAAHGELEDARIELTRLESDVAVVEARVARDADRLQHTSSVKDVQALEAELTSLHKRQNDLEEIELAVMERVEEREAVLAGVVEERDRIADDIGVAQQERDRDRAELQARRIELERDRTAVAAEVAEQLQALYEKRRVAGGGLGAALLRARTCNGCNITLTGNDLESVRIAGDDEVLFCPDCDRILVRTEESGI
ncbi:zinc ribbon domain-containing protein [Luethyella okanaganae]|uniref:Zinc ribbon domain-containing protein n=1 Tax=Luethyella okanaganae TaxID=69372 RepID=A0ABW1VFA2_9MICO